MYERDISAPGWDAIDGALQQLYRDVPPIHFGTLLPSNMETLSPLEGISVFHRDDPELHWHYITYGFTELYDKESESAAWSGWGYELTFRLFDNGTLSEPPAWPLALLQGIAEYVFGFSARLRAGHPLGIGSNFGPGAPEDFNALVFAFDPELRPLESPYGRVEFLQIVGLYESERAWIEKSRDARPLLARLSKDSPLLVTNPVRSRIVK